MPGTHLLVRPLDTNALAKRPQRPVHYPETPGPATREHVLHDLTSALIEESGLDAVLGRIARHLIRALEADAVRYFLWDPDRQALRHLPYGDVSSDVIGEAHELAPGEGIARGVFESGEALFVSDVEQDERVAARHVLPAEGTRSVALLPLKTAKGPVGLIQIGCTRVRPWSPQDRDLLAYVTPQVALILAKAMAYEQLYADLGEQRKQAAFQGMLDEIRGAILRIRNSGGIRTLVETLEHSLRKLDLPFDAFSLSLCGKEECAEYWVGPGGDFQQRVAALPDSATQKALLSQEPVYRDDLSATDPFHERPQVESALGRPLRSLLDVPFHEGALRVGSALPQAFSETHREILLKLAQGISSTLDRFREFLRLHEQSEQQARQLHRAQQAAALVQHAVAAAHDLRNPLQGIWGYLDLLSEKLSPQDPMYKLIQGVREGVDRMQGLADTLRHPTPFDAEPVVPVNMKEMLSRIMDRLAPLCAEQHIEVTRCLQEADASVLGRPGAIEQAFENLVGNAIEAMPHGGKLCVEMEQTSQQVRVCVRDTGPGIPASARPHLFDPFYSTKSASSLGLGLWIVREIVGQHAGTVKVQSQVGKGAAFTVEIPVLGASD